METIIAVIIGGLVGTVIFLACTLWLNSREVPITPPRYNKNKADDDLEKCGFAPRECRESHLAGDCPLCGAV